MLLTISSKTKMTRSEFTEALIEMGYEQKVIDELFLEAQKISSKIVDDRKES